MRRKPWGLFSGGPGSGLYKSVDGGNTWTELKRGLPAGIKGRIGVAVSPIDGKRVWAIVEAHDGGVFRSDDGGETWARTNDEARIRERAWYYSHIFADTKEIDTVYVLTLQIYKSSDGGKRFDTIRPRHADNHDLWMAPEDNRRMINGNDGGANIRVNGGRTWSNRTTRRRRSSTASPPTRSFRTSSMAPSRTTRPSPSPAAPAMPASTDRLAPGRRR